MIVSCVGCINTPTLRVIDQDVFTAGFIKNLSVLKATVKPFACCALHGRT